MANGRFVTWLILVCAPTIVCAGAADGDGRHANRRAGECPIEFSGPIDLGCPFAEPVAACLRPDGTSRARRGRVAHPGRRVDTSSGRPGARNPAPAFPVYRPHSEHSVWRRRWQTRGPATRPPFAGGTTGLHSSAWRALRWAPRPSTSTWRGSAISPGARRPLQFGGSVATRRTLALFTKSWERPRQTRRPGRLSMVARAGQCWPGLWCGLCADESGAQPGPGWYRSGCHSQRRESGVRSQGPEMAASQEDVGKVVHHASERSRAVAVGRQRHVGRGVPPGRRAPGR